MNKTTKIPAFKEEETNLICKINNLIVIRFVKKNEAERGSKEH